jgi:hypothetical protein
VGVPKALIDLIATSSGFMSEISVITSKSPMRGRGGTHDQVEVFPGRQGGGGRPAKTVSWKNRVKRIGVS